MFNQSANKIIVFGGTGDVGKLIVTKLLAQEHTVCVLTRQQKESQKNLSFITGNVLNKEIVEQIINQNDEVIVALGFNNSGLDTMSAGTANIISAMQKRKARRIICLSAQGAGDSWNDMPNDFKEMVLGNEILSASFKDHSIHEELIKNSNLVWTIVRPTEVINGVETSNYSVNNPNGNSIFQISNLDVAQFIVNEITKPTHLKEVVLITN